MVSVKFFSYAKRIFFIAVEMRRVQDGGKLVVAESNPEHALTYELCQQLDNPGLTLGNVILKCMAGSKDAAKWEQIWQKTI